MAFRCYLPVSSTVPQIEVPLSKMLMSEAKGIAWTLFVKLTGLDSLMRQTPKNSHGVDSRLQTMSTSVLFTALGLSPKRFCIPRTTSVSLMEKLCLNNKITKNNNKNNKKHKKYQDFIRQKLLCIS